MKKRAILALSAILAFSTFACNDSQKFDEEKQEGVESYKVEVRVNDVKNGEADLADLADKVVEVTAKEQTSKGIKLADIISKVNNIEASVLDAYLANYKCDFESADDGFRPSMKGDRCAPLSCEVAKKAYVNTDSHKLFFADDSGVTEGCYSVSNIGAILMYDADKE